jgi:hypothetical protein
MKTFKQFNEWFGKKKETKEYLHLTEPQRDIIRKHFPRGNVDTKYSNGEYVLPHNAMGQHKNKEFNFRNDGGKLMASVAHYSGKIEGSPAMHTDHHIKDSDDIEKLKSS